MDTLNLFESNNSKQFENDLLSCLSKQRWITSSRICELLGLHVTRSNVRKIAASIKHLKEVEGIPIIGDRSSKKGYKIANSVEWIEYKKKSIKIAFSQVCGNKKCTDKQAEKIMYILEI